MTVCQTCGDKGETQLLIHCKKCHGDSVVHHYCLDRFATNDDMINWTCEECAPNIAKAIKPPRKCERIGLKKERAIEVRNSWKKRINYYRSSRAKKLDYAKVGLDDVSLLTPYCSISSQDMMRNSSYVTHGNQELSKQQIRKQELEDEKDGESMQEYLEPIETKAPPLVPPGDSIWLNIPYNKKCLDFDDYVCAQPIIDPIWRGCFRIMSKENDTLVQIVSHLSNNACSKVYDVSTALPMVLDLEILSRCDAWPKSFQKSPPTDNNIGLFFFPENERDERLFDSLLDDIIERNLVLKAVIDDLELLIFSSLELPQQHWRFRRKYYLWGVFKQTQCSLVLVPTDPIAYSSSTEFVPVPKFKNHIENQDERDFVKTRTTRSPRSPLSTCSSYVSNMTNSPILPKVESCSPYSLPFRSFNLSRKNENIVRCTPFK